MENEIIMLLIGIGVLVMVFVNRERVKRISQYKTLMAAFIFMLTGWVMTVLESFLWTLVLNYIEHICYTLSSISLVVWCGQVVFGKEETG